MNYSVEIAESVEKSLRKVPKKDRLRIIETVDLLKGNPRPAGCKKLVGTTKGSLYRLRAGNYRIVYSIRDSHLLILVIDIGHRKDIYK